MVDSSNSPPVQHPLTSWWSVSQLILSPLLFQTEGRDRLWYLSSIPPGLIAKRLNLLVHRDQCFVFPFVCKKAVQNGRVTYFTYLFETKADIAQ